VNAMLADVDDVTELVAGTIGILESSERRLRLRTNGLSTARLFALESVASCFEGALLAASRRL
jgi:hypothetical protein